jgi:hypothetical protein
MMVSSIRLNTGAFGGFGDDSGNRNPHEQARLQRAALNEVTESPPAALRSF